MLISSCWRRVCLQDPSEFEAPVGRKASIRKGLYTLHTNPCLVLNLPIFWAFGFPWKFISKKKGKKGGKKKNKRKVLKFGTMQFLAMHAPGFYYMNLRQGQMGLHGNY